MSSKARDNRGGAAEGRARGGSKGRNPITSLSDIEEVMIIVDEAADDEGMDARRLEIKIKAGKVRLEAVKTKLKYGALHGALKAAA